MIRRIQWLMFLGILLTILVNGISCSESHLQHQINKEKNKTARDIFFPRMDYDQWKPLGRGDPLKNDPTYDYVPPVLDKVQYWLDASSRKSSPSPENQKKEILLLGISSKKSSAGNFMEDSRKTMYDSFLKIFDGPKFTTNQRIARPQFNSLFRSRVKNSERNSHSKINEQRIPYTVLVPPPITNDNPSNLQSSSLATFTNGMFSSLKPTSESKVNSTPQISSASKYTYSTSPDVTVQASNLIYSSSSQTNINDWNKPSTEINRQKVSWNSHPSANLVLMDNQIYHGFKDSAKPVPESYVQVNFNLPIMNYTGNTLLEANSDHINLIATPTFGSKVEIMHKGEVSDDNLDISNTYVKIGKTEAQVHASDQSSIPIMAQSVKPPDMDKEMILYPKHGIKIEEIPYTPVTPHFMEDIQTMQPTSITSSPMFSKPNFFSTEKSDDSGRTPTISTFSTNFNLPTTEKVNIEETTEHVTTTFTALTTDSLFKHYKQPMEPLKGPLYLIIQGHSKVKTYKPKATDIAFVQETNEIVSDRNEDKNLVVGQLNELTKQLKLRQGRSKLHTLKHVVETGLGAIKPADFKDESSADRRNDIQETELQAGFEVTGVATSEKYHKGIVEAARKIKAFNQTETS